MDNAVTRAKALHCPMPNQLDDGPHHGCKDGVACLVEFVNWAVTGEPEWAREAVAPGVLEFSQEVLDEAGVSYKYEHPCDSFDAAVRCDGRGSTILRICHAYRRVAERHGFDTSNQPELPPL